MTLTNDITARHPLLSGFFNADAPTNVNPHNARIEIAANTKSASPLRIVWDAASLKSKTSPVFLHVAAGAEIEIEEYHLGNATEPLEFLTNVTVDANATVTHRRFELTDDKTASRSQTTAEVSANGVFNSLHFTMGGKKIEHRLHVKLQDIHAKTDLNALYAVTSGRNVSHETIIEHLEKNTFSKQVYKGVIQKGAKSDFNGRVVIHRNAPGSEAHQLNKNLLLEKGAVANTKPQLEIDNDDVKCSHGATVGQINREELFYLMSRAIARDEALKMLVRGFAEDALGNNIPADSLKAVAGILDRDFFTTKV